MVMLQWPVQPRYMHVNMRTLSNHQNYLMIAKSLLVLIGHSSGFDPEKWIQLMTCEQQLTQPELEPMHLWGLVFDAEIR